MIPRFLYFLTIIITSLSVLCGCGDSDSFVIEGKFIVDAPQSVKAVYFAEGALHNIPASVNDGKFIIRGKAPEATIVDLYLPDRTRIATIVLENSETIECEVNASQPYSFKLKGNDTSEALCQWVNDNAKLLESGDALKINEKIAKYITDNSDNLLSTVLLLSYYDSSVDPVTAAKLFDGIKADARPTSMVEGYSDMVGRMKTANTDLTVGEITYYISPDSLGVFKPSSSPYTVLAVTSQALGRDTIKGVLEELNSQKKMKVLELSVDVDSVVWRSSIAPDSARWSQGWLPGGIMSPGLDAVEIPRLPYFIVVDSTGNQQLRTHSITQVANFKR